MPDPALADLTNWWWLGLVWATMMGWAGSSYLSNFVYRLPRNEPFFVREPYCGDCNHPLKPIDLAPVVSYALTMGKCRYCGSGIPFSYFILELLFPLASALIYMKFGFGDMFLLFFITSGLLIVMAFAAYDDDYVASKLALALAGLGVLTKTLQQQTILPGLLEGFYGFVIGMVVYALLRKKEKKQAEDVVIKLEDIPHYVWLLAAAGIWVNWLTIPHFLISLAIAGLILTLMLKKRSAESLFAMAYAPALFIAICAQY